MIGYAARRYRGHAQIATSVRGTATSGRLSQTLTCLWAATRRQSTLTAKHEQRHMSMVTHTPPPPSLPSSFRSFSTLSSPPSPPRPSSDCARPPTIPPLPPLAPIPTYTSRGERVPNPKTNTDRTREGDDDGSVIYCRWPDSDHRQFLFGSDGSGFSETTKRWTAGTERPGRVTLLKMPYADRVGHSMVLRPRAILLAHGYPQPNKNSILHHRDGDITNDRLDNLVWLEPTDYRAYPELVSEVRDSALRGSPIELRYLPQVPEYLVCSDGRIWSTANRHWIQQPTEETEADRLHRGNRFFLNLENAYFQRPHMIWEAFYGRPPIPGAIIQHLDGDRSNCHINNLFESISPYPIPPPPPMKADQLRERPPPVPKEEPTIAQADPQRVCQKSILGEVALPGVAYAFYPEPNFQHYIVGSDGSVRNSDNRLFLMKPRWSDQRTYPRVVVGLYPYRRDEFPNTQCCVDELVLIAHGHPRPDPNAIVRHRDDNPANCRLDNLYWESTADVMRHQIAIASARGEELKFVQHPEFPRIWLASDSRIWSHTMHGWLKAKHRISPYSNIARVNRSILISQLIWEAFTGRRVGTNQAIRPIDGNVNNRRFDNLKLIDRMIHTNNKRKKQTTNNDIDEKEEEDESVHV